MHRHHNSKECFPGKGWKKKVNTIFFIHLVQDNEMKVHLHMLIKIYLMLTKVKTAEHVS